MRLANCLKIWIAVTLGCALAGCAQTIRNAGPDAPGYNYVEEHVLGVGDTIQITVYEEPDLSSEFTVDSIGQISMPLVGEIDAAGVTLTQLRNIIRERLSRTLLANPRVSAEVVSYQPYYIYGEIASPGSYPSLPRMTVQNAIASAGGYTYRANRSHVFIKHADADQVLKYKLTPDLYVRPGDSIQIGDRLF